MILLTHNKIVKQFDLIATNFHTTLISFLYCDYFIYLFHRHILQCACTGASWPAILPLTAVWIKPVDRSKFMANMMASALGAAITMPICGFLIEKINWQSTFYFTGKNITLCEQCV